jgi:hypothetical protein
MYFRLKSGATSPTLGMLESSFLVCENAGDAAIVANNKPTARTPEHFLFM